MGAFLIDNDSCILFHNDTNSGSSSGISAHTGYRQALPHWPLKDLKTSLFFSGWSDLTIKCLILCHMGQSCFFFISQMIMLNEIPKYPLFFHLSPLLKFGHYGWSEYSRLHCIVNILNACQLYKNMTWSASKVFWDPRPGNNSGLSGIPGDFSRIFCQTTVVAPS